MSKVKKKTHCMVCVGLRSSQPSLTSVTMSSIHFLSAAVNAAERSSLGSRNSKEPVSIYERRLGFDCQILWGGIRSQGGRSHPVE